MFSISQNNYSFTHGSKINIYKINLKNKTKKLIFKREHVYFAFFSGIFLAKRDLYNYVEIHDGYFYNAIFNGEIVEIEINRTIQNIYPDLFVFDKEQHQIFFEKLDTGVICIYNVITGKIVLHKDTSFDNVMLSPSKNKVLISNYENEYDVLYILDTDVFIDHLLNTNMDCIEKYKIHIKYENRINDYEWINDEYINVCYTYKYDFNIYSRQAGYIYNVNTGVQYDVECDIGQCYPYVINGMFYFFNQNNIIAISDKITVIPNPYKIKHYNYVSEILISEDYEIYKLIHEKHFVPTKFERKQKSSTICFNLPPNMSINTNGEISEKIEYIQIIPFDQIYYDYRLAPIRIQKIVKYMLKEKPFNTLPYEIIECIYIELLKIDYFNLIY